MRKNIIAGNWKMNYSIDETKKFLEEFIPKVRDAKCEVVICPPFTSLSLSRDLVKGTNIKLGAQNMHFEESGAYTGEISPLMLKGLVEYVILGHSERRTYYNETDESINKKIITALKHNFIPMLCVGETLSEKESNRMEEVLKSQVTKAFLNISKEDAKKVVIAYEPVWAIGTGKTATSIDADKTIGYIREVLKGIYDEETSLNISILYGGSVKPSTIKEQMSMENIDGALVGGASLLVSDFESIVKF